MTKSDETNIEVIKVKIENIEKTIQTINNKLDRNYVTRLEFEPVKRIVYGMVSLVLISVIGALIALVLR